MGESWFPTMLIIPHVSVKNMREAAREIESFTLEERKKAFYKHLLTF